MEDATRSDLALLGYNPLWLEYGFLDVATLREQVAYYHTGEDTNTEHYRFATFRQTLSSRLVLQNEEIDHYISLALQDEDSAVSLSARVLLLEWKGLKTEQQETLSRHPDFALPLLQKHLLRRRLLDLLVAGPLTSEVFERCIASQDGVVMRQLIDIPDLLPQQLEALAEQGVNRAIRNVAKHRLLGMRRKKGLP